MLGPITSAGRTGWECKPERAASSSGWHQAELPPARVIRDRCGLLLAGAVLTGLMTAAATAQTYSTSRPLPRTTSEPALRTLATQREIEERFTIGLSALSRNDWKPAIAEFERIVALNPPEPKGSTARYDLAIAYANDGRNDDAARELARHSRSIPVSSRLWRISSPSISRAAISAKRARLPIVRRPRSGFCARALLARHRRVASRRCRNRASGLRKTPARKPLVRGRPLRSRARRRTPGTLRRGRTRTAERAALAPSYARARFALGVVLLREGEHAAARNAFEATRDAAGDPALQNIAAAMRHTIPYP